MVLSRNHPHAGDHVAVFLAILAAVACVGIALLLAERMTRAINPRFFSFLTRVFGLLLSAIAVQLVVNGIVGLT
jgi:multiple antibiotic resistance protein